MQWQLFIYTKLNFEDRSQQVISDHTGILSSKPFLSFLDEKAVSYILTDKVPEMLTVSLSNSKSFILTNLIDVPAFITNKFAHKHFTLADLPINGESANILKKQVPETILHLLDYVYATDIHQVVTNNNIGSLLVSAQSYAILNTINSLLVQVNSILQLPCQMDAVLELARVWGNLVYLSAKLHDNRYQSLIEQVDSFSSAFVLSNGMEQVYYASTPGNPKSVDRILSNIKSEKHEKIALICFDCMGYAEWHLLQEYLTDSNFSFTVSGIYTMLPSVTSISRSAIFHGSRDVYNIKSPGRSNEAKAFADFFPEKQTKYFTDEVLINDDSLLGYDCISILYPFFDDLSHSAQFPPNETSKALYFDSVRGYLNKSAVLQTLQTLQNNGFAIYICSDHGSVVAKGNGHKLEKYLIDNFAKRAAIIPIEAADLINQTKISIPFVKDKLIALPEGRMMYAAKNKIEINHGGITVEEMVVPFIKVKSNG